MGRGGVLSAVPACPSAALQPAANPESVAAATAAESQQHTALSPFCPPPPSSCLTLHWRQLHGRGKGARSAGGARVQVRTLRGCVAAFAVSPSHSRIHSPNLPASPAGRAKAAGIWKRPGGKGAAVILRAAFPTHPCTMPHAPTQPACCAHLSMVCGGLLASPVLVQAANMQGCNTLGCHPPPGPTLQPTVFGWHIIRARCAPHHCVAHEALSRACGSHAIPC